MFDVYVFATPASIKVSIAREELGLDYTLHAVNVRQGEHAAVEDRPAVGRAIQRITTLLPQA